MDYVVVNHNHAQLKLLLKNVELVVIAVVVIADSSAIRINAALKDKPAIFKQVVVKSLWVVNQTNNVPIQNFHTVDKIRHVCNA